MTTSARLGSPEKSEWVSTAPDIPQNDSLLKDHKRPHYRQRKRNCNQSTNLPYRHVPCSAASDFARTATAEPATKEQSYKPSHSVADELETAIPFEEQVNQTTLNSKQSKSLNDTIEAGGVRREAFLRRRFGQKIIHCPDGCHSESEDEHSHDPSKQCTVGRGSLSGPNPFDRPDWTEKDECSEVDDSVAFTNSAGKTVRMMEQAGMFEEHDLKRANSWNCLYFLRR